jgi:hypothetical protein
VQEDYDVDLAVIGSGGGAAMAARILANTCTHRGGHEGELDSGT